MTLVNPEVFLSKKTHQKIENISLLFERKTNNIRV